MGTFVMSFQGDTIKEFQHTHSAFPYLCKSNPQDRDRGPAIPAP